MTGKFLAMSGNIDKCFVKSVFCAKEKSRKFLRLFIQINRWNREAEPSVLLF